MSQYQRREDLTGIPDLLGLAAKEGSAFMAFHHSMEREDGIIPRKYRELLALGVALTTQCAYCIDAHTRQARANGATKQEIAEAAFVAAAVQAGGTLAHSLMALRIFDEDEKAAWGSSAEGRARNRDLEGSIIPSKSSVSTLHGVVFTLFVFWPRAGGTIGMP